MLFTVVYSRPYAAKPPITAAASHTQKSRPSQPLLSAKNLISLSYCLHTSPSSHVLLRPLHILLPLSTVLHSVHLTAFSLTLPLQKPSDCIIERRGRVLRSDPLDAEEAGL